MDAYKARCDPKFLVLVEMVLAKKVKKTKDINGMSMGPPLGLKPASVDQDVAVEFVKELVPLAWKAIKSMKKKKNMSNLRKLFSEGKSNGLFGSAAPVAPKSTAARTTSAAEAIPSSAVPANALHKMKSEGLDQKAAEMWHSAFEVLDTDNEGAIGVQKLGKFFGRFGESVGEEELRYIISRMVRKGENERDPIVKDESKESVRLVDFATFMNDRMRLPSIHTKDRQPRFGATFDLITGSAAMMTAEHVKAAMAAIQEPITDEEAGEMAAETPDKQRFMNVLNGHIMNEIQKLGFESTGGPPSIGGFDESLAPYIKMAKYMVPKQMIAMKMKQKGVPKEKIDAFIGTL